MMGGTTVGVPCSVRDAVAKTAAAAKMPTPAAYIVPTKEPNAFAAGRGRDRVVAVTQGLVDLLDRRELEAVVAHEVGHLKHGDTGRAAQAAAMLSGLSTAKRAGDRMLANKRKEKSDASVAAALAAAGAASSAAGLLLRLAGSSAQNHAGRCDGVEVGASSETKKSQRRREAGATSSPRTPSPRSSSTPARWRARSRRSRPRARRGTSCTRGPAPTRTRTLATTTGRRAGSGRTRPSRLASPRSNRARRPDARRRRPGRGSPPKRSRSRSRKFSLLQLCRPHLRMTRCRRDAAGAIKESEQK